VNLRRALRASTAAACIVLVAAPPSLAEVALRASAPLDVRVAQAEAFSHIEFHWMGGARMTARREGQTLTLRFNRDAKPDLAILHSVPVRWLKSAEARHDGGALTLVLTLSDDADAKVGSADGAEFVNLFQKAETQGQAAQAPPARPNPVPTGGVVAMQATATGPQMRFDFPWANPLGAAVFRRGEAIWIVFDAAAKIDLSKAPRGAAQFVSMQAMQGSGYSAVRIITRAPIAYAAQSDGATWSLILAPFNPPPFQPVKVERSDADGPAALAAAVSGASAVYWLTDPAVGDRIAVVTALGPAKGLPGRRDYVQMSLLPTAQGLAVTANTDDLDVSYSGDLVTIGRAKGLTLSPTTSASRAATLAMDAPKPAALPGLIGAEWANTGPGGFLARYDQLLSAVANEQVKGVNGPTGSHLALARFLVGSELSYEAIGVLNDALRQHPQLGSDPEFRGLRGIARVMAGRPKEAETDFSAPQLADDASAANWRGYIAAQASQWTDARREFAAGASAMNQFSPLWRSRFGQAGAQAALGVGDNAGALAWINFALAQKVAPEEELTTRLLQARLFEARGEAERALAVYQALTRAPTDAIAGPANLRATQIQLNRGTITPAQAASTFDGLRFRWRGGAFELETIRTLGQLYLNQGRYREALEALRSAGKRLPDLPEAVQLQADLQAAFKALFLDGQADGLEPVQAVALFYDFKELTPVGADGDMMVRKLTRRLVDVDLLGPAEELLKYQAENRLDGVPRAQVATDLALVYLMDKRPEDALNAINASRTTVLPNALNLQRRVISARALGALGRYDAGLEMLGSDTSPDAQDVRAEIAWKQKAWSQAAAILEKSLGERFKKPGPLSADEEGKVLRAGVAYTLAGDDAALTRLQSRYDDFIDQARNPEALRVALSGIGDGRVSLADYGRITADNQAFEGWVAKMKQRFREAPPPAPSKQASVPILASPAA
jgi:tetratricopeptide (TPR) repeat protein